MREHHFVAVCLHSNRSKFATVQDSFNISTVQCSKRCVRCCTAQVHRYLKWKVRIAKWFSANEMHIFHRRRTHLLATWPKPGEATIKTKTNCLWLWAFFIFNVHHRLRTCSRRGSFEVVSVVNAISANSPLRSVKRRFLLLEIEIRRWFFAIWPS